MNVNSIAEKQEKKSYGINKTAVIEKQNIVANKKNEKKDTPAAVATISDDAKNRYVNEQESNIDKIEKEKSLLSSNYYLKQEDNYYTGEIYAQVSTDYSNMKDIYKEKPEILANKYMKTYANLYNEINQGNDNDDVKKAKLQDLDNGYNNMITNVEKGKKAYQEADQAIIKTYKKIYSITHQIKYQIKSQDVEKELKEFSKYLDSKDTNKDLQNALQEFKNNYSIAYSNHEDMNKFVSNVKIY